MEDIKTLRAQVGRPDWGGHSVHILRIHLSEIYEVLEWFFEKTTNEYLGQNEKTVLKSIQKDHPPKAFKEVLLKAEQEGKKRKKVIEALK